MSAQIEKIAIPLGVGIDTKTDKKYVRPGSVLKSENGELDETGLLRKRKGYASVSTSIVGGGTLSGIKQLARYKDQLLALTTDGAYVQSDLGWVRIGDFMPSRITVSPLVSGAGFKPPGECPPVSIGYHDGNYIYFAEDDGNGHYEIRERETDAVAVRSDSSVANVRAESTMVVTGGKAIFVRTGGANVNVSIVDLDDPTASASSVSGLATDAASSGDIIDHDAVAYDDSHIIIAYRRGSGSGFGVLKVDTTGTVVASATGAGSNTVGPSCMMAGADSSGNIYVGYTLFLGGNFFVEGFDSSLDGLFGDSVGSATEMFSATGLVYAKAIPSPEDPDSLRIYVARNNGTYNEQTTFEVYDITSEGVETNMSSGFFTQGYGLASPRGLIPVTRPWTHDGESYVAAILCTDLDYSAFNAGFILKGAGFEVVGRFLPGQVGFSTNLLDSTSDLGKFWSEVVEPEPGVFEFLIHAIDQYDSVDDEAVVDIKKVTFDTTRIGNTIQCNGGLLNQSGILYLYDGTRLVCNGLEFGPTRVLTTGTAATGGNLSDGTYEIAVIYEWVDAAGKIHRSAPVFATKTLSGGGSAQTLTATVQTLCLGDEDKRGQVKIKFYRKELNGDTYYLAYEQANPSVSLSDGIVTGTLSLSDASLVTREELYTDGGILDNAMAPEAQLVALYGNRVALVSGDHTVQFSKLSAANEGIAFNEGLSISVPSGYGRIANLAEQDGQLLIFLERALFRIYGQGPNNFGVGAFSDPQVIPSTGTGATYLAPVAQTGVGTIYRSAKGFWLLDRSLQEQYIGAQIEGYNSNMLKALDIIDDQNQIRFLMSGDVMLLFDTLRREWSYWDGFTNGLHCVLGPGGHTYADSNDAIYTQDSNFTHAGAAMQLLVRTPWLRAGAISDWLRVHDVYVSGEYRSPHTLNVKLYYDYDDSSASQSVTFTVSGSVVPYIYNIIPQTQQCSAIMVEIYDSGQSGTNESMALEEVLLLVSRQPKRPMAEGRRS